MRKRTRPLIAAAAVLLALGATLLGSAENASAAESLSVNLASTTGPATGVGEGFLYGVSQDGTQPPDQYLQPLGITAFRGGGHVSGGWIGDGYQNGSGTQADVNTVIAQAQAADPVAVPRAVPGDPERHLRRGRRPALEHHLPVHQRELLQLGHLRRRRGERVAGDWAPVRLRHLERARYLRLLAGRRADQPVLPDVAQRLQGDPQRRPQCDHRRARLRLHPAAEPGRMAGLPVERQVQPGPCPTRSPTTKRATATIPWPTPAPSTATSPPPASRPPRCCRRTSISRRPADRRRDRVVPGPLRPVQLRQRDARQLGVLPYPEPDRGPHPGQRHLRAERQLVGDARLRRHDRFPGVHLRPVRVHRDLGGRGQLRQARRWPSSATTTGTPARRR